MHIYNQNAPLGFCRAFEELVRDSTLRGKTGAIVLTMDWATLEACASFRPHDQNVPLRPAGRGKTPSDLFVQVLSAVDPVPLGPSLPQTLEHPGPDRWWWLWFVDAAKTKAEQFLGVAIVEGATLRDAIEVTGALGINPGGRVASVACTRRVPNASWRNRLLTRQEVVAAGDDMEGPQDAA